MNPSGETRVDSVVAVPNYTDIQKKKMNKFLFTGGTRYGRELTKLQT